MTLPDRRFWKDRLVSFTDSLVDVFSAIGLACGIFILWVVFHLDKPKNKADPKPTQLECDMAAGINAASVDGKILVRCAPHQ